MLFLQELFDPSEKYRETLWLKGVHWGKLDRVGPVDNRPSTNSEECSHTTQTVGGMKLHVKNKHSISQVDGNTSLVENIEEETMIKHFSFESLCYFGRLLERLESELINVKKL